MSTPEEVELAKKKAELERLAVVLAEKELGLEECKITVAQFQHRYYSKVGKKYVELDELRAQIAELVARREPLDHELNQEAIRSRTQAKRAAEEYEGVEIEPQTGSFKPEESDEAKRLYRKIASIIHPDKAPDDDKSHNLRTRLMTELNDFYARKNITKMRSVLDQWRESPEAVSGEGLASELVRTIRAIAQIKRRKAEIKSQMSAMIKSDIHVLMSKVHDAGAAGRDILAEMSVSIDAEIQAARNELARLKG